MLAVRRTLLRKLVQNGGGLLSFSQFGEDTVEDADGAFEILPVRPSLRGRRNHRKIFLERLFRVIETASRGMDLSFEDQRLRIEGGVFADGGDGRVRLLAVARGVEETRTLETDELLLFRIGSGHLLELQIRVVVKLQLAELLDEFDVQFQIVWKLGRGKHGHGQAEEKACPVFHMGHGRWNMDENAGYGSPTGRRRPIGRFFYMDVLFQMIALRQVQ